MKKLTLSLVAFLAFVSVFGQNIQIRDIQFNQGFYFGRLSDNSFRTIYKIQSNSNERSYFRKIDFDSRLQMLDTTEFDFLGDFSLIQSVTNPKYTATLFASRTTSTVFVHLINNLNEKQTTFGVKLTQTWTARNQISISASHDSDHFYVLYHFKKEAWEIQKIDSEGKSVWNKMITDSKDRLGIEKIILLEENRIGIASSKNPFSRKALNEIQVLDASTGMDVYTKPLHDKVSKSTMDNSFLLDSAYYITGRKFFTNRVSNNVTGLPYLQEFNGAANKEIELTSGLMSLKTFWMDMIVDEFGNRYLIGETFMNESRGAYIMKGVITGLLTMGILRISWTVLKFQEIAIVSIDNREAPPLSMLKLIPRRVQVGSYTPGYSFAKYAYKTGQIRYWGHDNLGNIYLVDGSILKKYNLANRSFEELGQLPKDGSQEVVNVSDDYLVYLNRRKLNNLVEFKSLPIRKPK